MKALTFKDPGNRPFPPPDERSILLEQIRTEVSYSVPEITPVKHLHSVLFEKFPYSVAMCSSVT